MKIKDFNPEPIDAKAILIATQHGGNIIETNYNFCTDEFAKAALIMSIKNDPTFLNEINENEDCNLTLGSDISEIPVFFNIEFDCGSNSGDSLIFKEIYFFIVHEGNFYNSKILSFKTIEDIGNCFIGIINWKNK